MWVGRDDRVLELVARRHPAAVSRLGEARAHQASAGGTLAESALELGLISRRDLLQAAADDLGTTWAEELPATLSAAACKLVGVERMSRYGVAPLAMDESSVTLAPRDPYAIGFADELGFALEKEVRIVVADPAEVEFLVEREVGGAIRAGSGWTADLAKLPVTGAWSESDLEHLAAETPIIRYVNRILAEATRLRASDVHLEPFEQEFRIRCRVDGALHELPAPPRPLTPAVIARVKVLAGLNIAEHRIPQDGRIRQVIEGRAVDLRVSTLPTQFGESVVLRVLDQAAVRLELGGLGLPDSVEFALREVIRRPHGLLLVTGPTGSGKTTTLYSCLRQLNAPESKLLTVEDPVEYEVDGIMQVAVNPAAGLDFASALRSFLRQDPDVVMVGEIRDAETARIAVQASLTGHLVLSTLHTNDAPGAVTRLVDLGVEPYLLASTIEAVLAQRLLRRICPECKAPAVVDDRMRRDAGLPGVGQGGDAFWLGRGCASCDHTGYRGRRAIFEFLSVDEGLRELIASGAPLARIREHAARRGMTTLRAAGLALARAGETTLEEVLRHTS